MKTSRWVLTAITTPLGGLHLCNCHQRPGRVQLAAVGCSAGESDAPSSTTAVQSTAASTTPLESTTTLAANPVSTAHESLLTVSDLPLDGEWGRRTVEEDFWDSSGPGIQIMFCGDPKNLVAEPSLRELTAGLPAVTVFEGDKADLRHLVYADTGTTQVGAAFDDVTHELDECIAWWKQNPATSIVDEYADKGWHWIVERLDLPINGYDTYAIRYYLADADEDYGWGLRHTVVMVATETHLMLLGADLSVEESLDEELDMVVLTSALDRLESAQTGTPAATSGTSAGQIDPCDSTPRPSAPKRYSTDDEFVFGTDHLCELFTSEGINTVVADAYETHGLEVPVGQAGSHCCVEANGSSNTWLEVSPLSELSHSFESMQGFPTEVRVRNVSRGCVAFIPGVEAEVHVDGHDEVLLFGHFMPREFTTPKGCDPDIVNPVGFAILTEILRQMGWI